MRWLVSCAALGALAVLVVATGSAGCVDTAGDAGDASRDGFTIEPPGDGASSADAQLDGAPGVATEFRVAHLANDLGPVDICYRPTSSQAWEGPAFATAPSDAGTHAPFDASGDASASDAATLDASAADAGDLASGFRFGTVTRYVVAHASGTFDLALVLASDVSCARPIALGHVTFDAGKQATVVVMGLARVDAGAPNALAIAAFTDDATLSPTIARTRFIHAAVGATRIGAAPLSVAAITSGTSAALAARVEPAHASTPSESPPKIDALGYGSSAAIGGSSALRVTSLADGGAQVWTTSDANLGMTASSLHTGFVFDATGSGDLGVLWCDDTTGRLGSTTTCSVLR